MGRETLDHKHNAEQPARSGRSARNQARHDPNSELVTGPLDNDRDGVYNAQTGTKCDRVTERTFRSRRMGTVASLRKSIVDLCLKAATTVEPSQATAKVSKTGNTFWVVYELGGYMPEVVGSVKRGNKNYSVSVKLQVSMKEEGTTSAASKADIEI